MGEHPLRTTSLWVKENPGKHQARSLKAALGVEVGTALSELRDDGLLIEDVPPEPVHLSGAETRDPVTRLPSPRRSPINDLRLGSVPCV